MTGPQAAGDELYSEDLCIKALMNGSRLSTDREILSMFGRHPKASTIISEAMTPWLDQMSVRSDACCSSETTFWNIYPSLSALSTALATSTSFKDRLRENCGRSLRVLELRLEVSVVYVASFRRMRPSLSWQVSRLRYIGLGTSDAYRTKRVTRRIWRHSGERHVYLSTLFSQHNLFRSMHLG